MKFVGIILTVIGLSATQPVFSQSPWTYTSGDNTSWTVPSGVNYVKVEAWGGGGRGGSRTTNGTGARGGGGGGAYASSIISVTPGQTYYIRVGTGSSSTTAGGDSWFTTTSNSSSGALVLAKGGSSGGNNTTSGAAGGSYDGSIGAIRYNGGRGANGTTSGTDSGGGGGGSSAGASGLGVNATNRWGAVGPSGYDGIGGNGGATGGNNVGAAGIAPGGGGGGSFRNSNGTNNGGNGANGRVIITDLSALSYDLSIENTVDNNTPLAGDNVIFTVEVTNNASLQAQGVEVQNQLPDGFAYKSDNAPSGTTYNPSTGTWTIGNLPATTSRTLTITATVNPTGSYASVATLSADLENRNRSTSNITLFPQPRTTNLQLTNEVDSAMTLIGGEVVFTLTAHNAGPQDATGVTVENMLPSGLSHVSNSGGYDPNTGIWAIGGLDAGQSAILSIIATVNETGYFNSEAVISGDQFDPDLSNNTSSIRVHPMYPVIEIVLPAHINTYDLTGITIATPPTGAEVSWHSASPATTFNKIDALQSVRVGETYYVAFYDSDEGCYSATTMVRVRHSVLITNPMIRQRMK